MGKKKESKGKSRKSALRVSGQYTPTSSKNPRFSEKKRSKNTFFSFSKSPPKTPTKRPALPVRSSPKTDKQRGRTRSTKGDKSGSSHFRRIGSDPSLLKKKEKTDEEKLDEILGLSPVKEVGRLSVKRKNRYEGLSPVQDLSNGKVNERRGRGRGSFGSFSSLNLVSGDRSISFDELLPPPPPPPPKEREIKTVAPPPERKVSLHDKDKAFVDYTVVPLLLRSDMDYNEATDFGTYLKKRYKASHIRFIMSSPFELFAAMKASGLNVSHSLQESIIDDDYWKQNVSGNDRQRRTSFVYYKETAPTHNQNVRMSNKRKNRSSLRDSTRTEFNQERQVRNDDKEFRVEDLITGVMKLSSKD